MKREDGGVNHSFLFFSTAGKVDSKEDGGAGEEGREGENPMSILEKN